MSAPADTDMRRLLAQEGVKAVLLAVVSADEQHLALCRKVKANFKEISIPIIMCAPQWTHNGVLTALRYGARDILLKPFTAEELTTKVLRLVAAAGA